MQSKSLRKAIRDFDFEDFLTSNGADVEERAGEIAGTCPFCNWKRTSFYVSPVNGLYMCHYCGEKGGPVTLVSKILGVTYDKAVETLDRNFSITVHDEEEYHEPVVADIQLPTEFRPLAGKSSSRAAKQYLSYARSRNLDEEILTKYNIGYCAAGYYCGRIIVPVYAYGKVVSFVARAISKKAEKKVLTPPGNEQYSYLFNLDNIMGRSEVIVVEGVFDALSMPDMAVASFGKKITLKQSNLLRKAGVKKVIFCFDEDAMDETLKFAQQNWMTFDTYIVELPKNEDPSSLGPVAMKELLHDAVKMTPGTLRSQA